MLNRIKKIQSCRRIISRFNSTFGHPIITRTNLEYVSNPFHLNEEKNIERLVSQPQELIKSSMIRERNKAIKQSKRPKFKAFLKTMSNAKKKKVNYIAKAAESLEMDPVTQLPLDSGFDHILRHLRDKNLEEEDLGEFQKSFDELVNQLKLSSHSELLFFFRMNLSKANTENQQNAMDLILKKALAEEAVPNLEHWANTKYGITKEQLLEKIAFLLNFKKFQRNAFEEEQYKEQPIFNKEFLERDPFFKTLHPEARKELRNSMEEFTNNNETFFVTPDFEEFDFEGLTTNEFSVVESDIQKKYFFKKAQMLPEILGVQAKTFFKIMKRINEQTEKFGEGFLDIVSIMDDDASFSEFYETLGWTEDEIKYFNMRKKRTNQREFNRDDRFDEKFTEIREKIPQLEEEFDYTPLKEILYSFDTMKTLDSKITRLERETKMYDHRQPRIYELQNKLNMLIDKLPAHVRKLIINHKKHFVEQFMGKEYNVKGLRWKIVDRDVPCTLLDYTDSTPILPLAKLRLLNPTDLNTYLDEVFPWFKTGDINYHSRKIKNTMGVNEVTYYMDDLLEYMVDTKVASKGETKYFTDNLEDEEGMETKKVKTLKRRKSELYDETELDKGMFMLSEEEMKSFEKLNPHLKVDKFGFIFQKSDNKFLGSIESNDHYMKTNESLFKWDKDSLDIYSQKMDRLYYDEDNLSEDDDNVPYQNILEDEPTFFEEVDEFDDDENLDYVDNVVCHSDNEEDDTNMDLSIQEQRDEELNQELYEAIHGIDDLTRKKGQYPNPEEFEDMTHEVDNSYNIKGVSQASFDVERKVFINDKTSVFENHKVEDLVDAFTTKGNVNPEIVDFSNQKGGMNLKMDHYSKTLLAESSYDFYNTRENIYYVAEIDDPEFYQLQKQLALSNERYELYFGENEYQGLEIDGETEKLDFDEKKLKALPNFKKAQIGFKLHFMQHLKSKLKSKSNHGLSKNEKIELEMYKKIDKDPYYKHYMSTNFRNFALVNSEMMLETMSETNNPDLGFLIDARMNLKKMALKNRPSRNIIMDLKSKYDISGLKLEESKNQKRMFRSRISTFGSAHRKRGSALAVIQYPGTGKISVNRRKLIEYFSDNACRWELIKPIAAVDKLCQVDLKVYVHGGGYVGQSQACRLAVSKALMKLFPMARFKLAKEGFLRVDLRSKEAKKTGKIKARKDYTYVRR
jgi:small subunit ribosomal protein S9